MRVDLSELGDGRLRLSSLGSPAPNEDVQTRSWTDDAGTCTLASTMLCLYASQLARKYTPRLSLMFIHLYVCRNGSTVELDKYWDCFAWCDGGLRTARKVVPDVVLGCFFGKCD